MAFPASACLMNARVTYLFWFDRARNRQARHDSGARKSCKRRRQADARRNAGSVAGVNGLAIPSRWTPDVQQQARH